MNHIVKSIVFQDPFKMQNEARFQTILSKLSQSDVFFLADYFATKAKVERKELQELFDQKSKELAKEKEDLTAKINTLQKRLSYLGTRQYLESSVQQIIDLHQVKDCGCLFDKVSVTGTLHHIINCTLYDTYYFTPLN